MAHRHRASSSSPPVSPRPPVVSGCTRRRARRSRWAESARSSTGQTALDLEVSTHSQIFDPAVLALGGRWHAGLGDNAEASIEGTAHRVDDTGPSDADRSFYSGRAGIRTNPGKSGAAFFAGAGGGYAPAGGGFASADSGLAIGYDNCTVVPVMQASAFISQPLQARAIDVSDGDESASDTPKRTIGGVLRAGLRFSLSPSRCRAGEQVPWITLGFGSTTLADVDDSATLLGAGVGIDSAALDRRDHGRSDLHAASTAAA